jgi:polyferredoxin
MGVIGSSKSAKTLRKQLIARRRDNVNVLVFGEPGLCKDRFAYLVHYGAQGTAMHDGRATGPLLLVQCEKVSQRAERLFGTARQPGLLESVDAGTLVLNNAHCLNSRVKSQVARLILNGTYVSPGDGSEKRSRLRIVVVAEKTISEFEGLPKDSLAKIKVPALRIRRQDIRDLVSRELRRLCRLKGIPVPDVEAGAIRKLEAYDFPGNIRELYGLVGRALDARPKGASIAAELFWPAQSTKKLDLFKVNLFDVFPGLRDFLRSDFFPEQLNHGFTKYVFAAFVALLFIGPQTRDANFGLNLFWAWWWPGILLTYPLVGRLWCAICPFMIYGEVVQRWRLAQGAVLQKWPTEKLEQFGGWFLVALFFAILLWEEVWNLENTAYLSAWLLLLITAGAMVCSWFFERRMWCRHLCPIGGMNGLYAKLSLTELRSERGQCNAECSTYHCYKGGPAEGDGQETLGCPLYSHPASLRDNRDCVLCMTCLKACPHQNVRLNLRAPGVDFGFPFLFPVPGTSAAAEHAASAHEVALMLLLLGAVYCHRLPGLLSQAGLEGEAAAAIMTDRGFEGLAGAHGIWATAALAVPGLSVWLTDWIARAALATLAPGRWSPRPFVELAYCYLPLTWLASLAFYLDLGMTEAGRVLVAAEKTLNYFIAGVLGMFGVSNESALSIPVPVVVASPDVVAFLQGILLLAGAGFSSLLLRKLGRQTPLVQVHQILILFITTELFVLVVGNVSIPLSSA